MRVFLSFVAALLVAASSVPQAAGGRNRESDQIPPVRLNLELIGAELPTGARQTFFTEVQRIWRRQNVQLCWTTAALDPIHLSVRIDPNDLLVKVPSPEYAVAKFLRSESLIVISSASAERVVRNGLDSSVIYSGVSFRIVSATGLVMGRALAHEIGHYLLGPSHSPTGLMRSPFRVVEFVEPVTRAFNLSIRDEWRLAARLQSGLAARLASPNRPISTD
jgi:hypothetical protein